MVISCIHQPNYIPWMGLFHKIAKCDTWVVMDDVQFSKQGYTSRNWIKTPNGALLLVVPVKKGAHSLPICRVRIANEQPWKRKHVLSIESSYKQAPYFDSYWDKLKAIYDREWEYLAELNMAIIDYILDCLGISVTKIMASKLDCAGQATERIVDICKKTGTEVYLSGQGAKSYLDLNITEANGVKVVFDEYSAPSYAQQWGESVPNLSALDALFNLGPNARLLLDDQEV